MFSTDVVRRDDIPITLLTFLTGTTTIFTFSRCDVGSIAHGL